MLTKKTFVKAAAIARGWHTLMLEAGTRGDSQAESGYRVTATAVQESFVALFRDDNPKFDARRFRLACVLLPDTKARKVGRVSRCEDFPCCGHELGCCPSYDADTDEQEHDYERDHDYTDGY